MRTKPEGSGIRTQKNPPAYREYQFRDPHGDPEIGEIRVLCDARTALKLASFYGWEVAG